MKRFVFACVLFFSLAMTAHAQYVFNPPAGPFGSPGVLPPFTYGVPYSQTIAVSTSSPGTALIIGAQFSPPAGIGITRVNASTILISGTPRISSRQQPLSYLRVNVSGTYGPATVFYVPSFK